MTAGELLNKAMIALSSSKLLLDAGVASGACNRAYYAMFDAARAALLASKLSDDVRNILSKYELKIGVPKNTQNVLYKSNSKLVKYGCSTYDLGRAVVFLLKIDPLLRLKC